MENKKISINLKVDGKTLRFRVDIDSDEEVAYRKSAEHINKLLQDFRSKYGTSQFDKETQLMYILLDQLKSLYLEQKADDLFLNRFEQLSALIEKEIK